jgi:endonuclease YncB( thermonuclease family)
MTRRSMFSRDMTRAGVVAAALLTALQSSLHAEPIALSAPSTMGGGTGMQLAQSTQPQQSGGAAAAKALPVFEIPQTGVNFQTGDTWEQSGQTFRLYGVQSCIRGTNFTNAVGSKADCGEASLAYFAALVRDTKPRCTAVAKSGAPPVNYSVCAAHVGATTLDLGTVLITEGFAFAAIDGAGKPINFQYAVAEAEAQKNKRGLWAVRDLPYPNSILLRAAAGSAHPQ